MSNLPLSFTTNKGIKLTVKEGSITDERVDVIINSTSAELKLDRGTLSQAILNAAGSQIQDECTQKAPNGVGSGEVVETSGGNLHCGSIYHGSLAAWDSGAGEVDFLAFIRSFLDKAHKDGKTSMAIPAIATGVLKVPPKTVAQLMYEEIIKFSTDTKNTTLKDIRVVVFGNDVVLQEFASYFSGVIAPKSSLPVPVQGSAAKTKDFKQLDATFTTHGGITVNIWITKNSIALENSDVIVNIVKKDMDLDFGAISSSILKMAGKDLQKECNRKCPGGAEYGKVFKTSGCNLKCQFIYHGAIREWTSGSGEMDLGLFMNNILELADSDSIKSISLPSIGTGVMLGFPAQKVAQNMISEIEEFSARRSNARLKSINIVLFHSDHDSIKAFQDEVKTRYNITGNYIHPDITLPESWDEMDVTESVKLVTLDKGSEEYQAVSKKFTDMGGPQNIQQIQRIQCKNLYQLYVLKKIQMTSRVRDDPSYSPEHTLYHGTSDSSIDDINTDGFNRAFAGKNATAYGVGTYFAVHASYSAKDAYSPKDSNGLKRIYVCRVLTGEYAVGSSDMKTPPVKDKHLNIRYDSVVDNVKQPSIFVVFYDAQAYPDYLITFKT